MLPPTPEATIDRSNAGLPPVRTETSRRGLLRLAAGAAFVVGFYVPLKQSKAEEFTFAPNAFISIDRTGVVTLVMPQVEMGQGIYTSLAMCVSAWKKDPSGGVIGVQKGPLC